MGDTIDVQIPGQPVGGPYLAELQAAVAKLLNIRGDKFPGAQPVSFQSSHLKDLEHENFFVCEKTDGLRAILYLCYNAQISQYEAFFIDRKNAYFYVQDLRFPTPESAKTGYRQFLRDTLIDGELVVDTMPNGKRVLRYLIFDCMVYQGKSLLSRPLTKRLGYFSEYMMAPLSKMRRDRPDLYANLPFTIERKPMELSYGLDRVFESLPTLRHKSDGLIFTSSEAGYTPGTDEKIIKWKPADENSVDFRLHLAFEGDRPVSWIQLWHGGRDHRNHAVLHVDDATREVFGQQPELDGRIAECRWDPEYPGNWRFMRFRDDKNTANHVSVYTKIMQSIEDCITREELSERAPIIRENWKRREQTQQEASPPKESQTLPAQSAVGPSDAQPIAQAAATSEQQSEGSSSLKRSQPDDQDASVKQIDTKRQKMDYSEAQASEGTQTASVVAQETN
ncbi:hypothetical protein RI367_003387 [Sorochytrium milnesiophthora]